jgi:AraC-type DNA-binding domain-containing proteins
MQKKSSNLNPKNFIPGKEIIHQELEVQQQYSNIIFSNQEEQHTHNSYEQELFEMKCIENGDLELLETCWLKLQPTSYGTLSKDRIRNIKNHCIIIVAFASRAAIRGGALPEVAYSLCDSYIQKMEHCTESIVLAQLAHRAEQHFTSLVNEINSRKIYKSSFKTSSHVKNCKKYIFSHLHDKLTVQQIADELHLNSNYLSDLFKKQEGQTILQFILKEKIKLAQNMLIYSNYTFSEIANYLGFSSQSHLGMHFKNSVDMTLSKYRTQYKSKNLTNEI